MKPSLIAVLLSLASAGVALAQPAQPKAGSAPAKAAPAAEKAKSGAKEKEKEEEIPKIEGITIERRNGTFMGIQIANGNFVLKFYDKEKKKTKPDVSRAALRWPVRYQPGDERTVLSLGAEDSLTSGFIVRPPHQFRLVITLLAETPDGVADTYVVDYR